MRAGSPAALSLWLVLLLGFEAAGEDMDKMQAQLLQAARISLTAGSSRGSQMVDQVLQEPLWLPADCLWGLYDLNYGPVQGCTPIYRHQCGRVIIDGFVSPLDASKLRRSLQAAMVGLYHQVVNPCSSP